MKDISRSLQTHSHDKYEFTESEAEISFSKVGDQISVTSSYTPGTIVTSQSELDAATDKCLQKVISELLSSHPTLKDNPILVEHLKTNGGTLEIKS